MSNFILSKDSTGGKGSQGVMNIWPSYSSSCDLSPSSLNSEASSSGLEEKRRLHVNEPDSLFNWRSARGSLVSRARTSRHLHPEWDARGACASACARGWRREGFWQAWAAVGAVHAPVFQPAALRSWEIIEKKIYF